LPEKHVENEKEGGWIIGHKEFDLENEELRPCDGCKIELLGTFTK
jgi:hypothetical protein